MRNQRLIFLLLLAAAFAPYLITCFYALPFADDFCFGWTASEKISFVQKFLNQYLLWNGRYTSDVLVNLHPITTGSLSLYQLASFVSVIATPVVFFVFVRQWINSAISAIMVSLAASLFYLCYLPNITEGVYWYIGLVNYHWGGLCFILQLAVITKLLRGDNRNFLLHLFSLLLLVTAIGFNEIAAALVPAYYLGMLIYFKVSNAQGANQSRNQRILITHLVFAVTASAFVICSPGNFSRGNNFTDRFNLLHSTLFGILQALRFTGRWIISVPSIALSLVAMVNADKVNSETLRRVNWSIWLALLLFTVFTAAFIPYMATGVLGQHRTLNYVFPFFIILWLGLLISISTKYRLCEERTPETSGIRVFIMGMVGIAVMSVSGNAFSIFKDLHSGAFPAYKTEFMERQSAILKQPAAPVLPLNSIPHTYQVVDAKTDSSWWVNVCMKKFYTKTDIVLH